MQVGIDSFAAAFDENSRALNPADRLRHLVEQIEHADEVGLDAFGIGEHHRREFLDSAPAVILGAAAARTQRIRLTSAVTLCVNILLFSNRSPPCRNRFGVIASDSPITPIRGRRRTSAQEVTVSTHIGDEMRPWLQQSLTTVSSLTPSLLKCGAPRPTEPFSSSINSGWITRVSRQNKARAGRGHRRT